MLFQTAQSLTQTLDLGRIFHILNLRAMTLTGATTSYTGLRTPEGFSCSAFFEGPVSRATNIAWPSGAGIPGWVLANRKTYLTNDAANDLLVPPEVRRALTLRNTLCVPIFDVPKTEVIAFFAVENKSVDFDETDVATAEGLAEIASIALQNAFSYQKIREAEDQLQRLSAQLMASQDEERRQVARSLHEGAAQDLTGVKLLLGQLSRDSDLKPSSLRVVTESEEMIERALGDIRTLSDDLHPALLELGGLGIGIRRYAEKFGRISGVALTAEISQNLPRLAPAQQIAVFRVFQESLTNIQRHSGSATANVRVWQENDCLVLQVSDSGTGFAANSQGSGLPMGLGIAGMKERARELGADLKIASNSTQGTTVRFVLPLKRRNAEREVGDKN